MIVENEFGLLEKMLGIEQLKFPSPALPTILGWKSFSLILGGLCVNGVISSYM